MRYILSAIIICLSLIDVKAQKDSAAILFDKANELYANEEYHSAVEKYEAIIERGYISGQVFFNLGNAYFKLNDLPRAIVNYERASLFDPKNEDIEYNLKLSRTYLTDKIDAIPEFRFKTWITRLSLLLSSNLWAVLSLVFFVLALVLFLVYWKSQQAGLKKSSFVFSMVSVVIMVVTLYLGKRQKQHIFQNPYAIVEAPTVMVKSTPDTESTDLFVIHEGLKVQVTDAYTNWYEIKLPNGNKGWMQAGELIRISDF